MIAPWGRYMNPMCGFGLAAVWARAVQAGIIASRSGRPTVTPAPRRNVRRERCFFVMNDISLLKSYQLSAISRRLSAIGYRLSAIGLSAIGLSGYQASVLADS